MGPFVYDAYILAKENVHKKFSIALDDPVEGGSGGKEQLQPHLRL